MTDLAEASPGPEDAARLRALVVECLERLEDEGPAALEDLCAAEPQLAGPLRRRVEALGRIGLLAGGSGAARDFPERLGELRLIERLGRGGMGVVYLAEDERLSRRVALKVVRPEQLYFEGTRERFEREVRTVAQLQHPGIVPVHAVGESNGVPWFTMEYVRGASLDRVLAELAGRDAAELGGADLARAIAACTPGEVDAAAGASYVFAGSWEAGVLELFRQLADALEHAHQRGVLHRDLKPSNMIVTPEGRAMLLDFGLARAGGEERLTRTGSQLGTPHYMSPEQARGELGRVDERSDLYSLGASLYELLCLRPAFDGSGVHEVLLAIASGTPERPRARNRALSWEAETVCLTAMDADPARRYARAADLARDLANVLEHRPIDARRAGALLRARRWVEREPAGALALALGFLLVVGGPAVLAWQARAASRRIQQEAQVALARASDVLRLSALQDVEDLEERARELWPAAPEHVEAYRGWLARARALVAARAEHARTLAEIRARALPWSAEDRARDRGVLEARWREELDAWNRERSLAGHFPMTPDGERQVAEMLARAATMEAAAARGEGAVADPDGLERLRGDAAAIEAKKGEREGYVSRRLSWRFEALGDRWWQGQLEKLVAELDELADPERGLIAGIHPEHGLGIARRLAFAETLALRTIEGPEAAARWSQARASIADPEDCPLYGGLLIEPQLGLLPLGRNPESGLWEFAHLASGEPAEWDEELGAASPREESGIVLVLLPGGAFTMGAQPQDPGGPNYDPDAAPDEGPPHEVVLGPFFAGKHELTQAQWQRVTGDNPSGYRWGSSRAQRRVTGLDPVENVSWDEVVRELARMDLALPTEAQWEYAARGGTDTPWSFGRDRGDAPLFVNLADSFAKRSGAPWSRWEADLDDGFGVHAPIGSFLPNAFGLHDVHGNVLEWVLDPHMDYPAPVLDGSGRRAAHRTVQHQYRGGSFEHLLVDCRSAERTAQSQHKGMPLGVRPARALRGALSR